MIIKLKHGRIFICIGSFLHKICIKIIFLYKANQILNWDINISLKQLKLQKKFNQSINDTGTQMKKKMNQFYAVLVIDL